MSGRHVGTVFKHSRHGGSELLVLVSIAETLNDKTGTWYMSVSQIAKRCKLTDRHVFRILPKLRQSNELGMRKGGPQGQNVFWLKLQPVIEAVKHRSADVFPMTPTSETKEEVQPAGMTAVSLEAHQIPGLGVTPTSEPVQCASTQGRDDVHDTNVTAEMTTSTGGHDIRVSGSMTSGTPITRHSEKIITSPGSSPSDPAETVARLLREGGVEKVKVTKEFRQAVDLGATVASLTEAIAESGHAGNPFAYDVTRVLNNLRNAKRANVEAAGSPTPVASSVVYTEDPVLQKIKRDATLAVPVPAFVRELSRKFRTGGG